MPRNPTERGWRSSANSGTHCPADHQYKSAFEATRCCLLSALALQRTPMLVSEPLRHAVAVGADLLTQGASCASSNALFLM